MLILVVTLLLGFGFLPGNYFVSASDPVQPIQVDFPSPLGTSATSLPLRITIPNPLIFGYPRVPTELRVSIAGYRRSSLLIPLLINVDLNNPVSLSRYLNNPIEINVDFPLPIRKEGFYRVTVDVKCLYGPNYITTYWYSYTLNKEIQIVPEKVHITGIDSNYYYGYSFSQAQIYDFLGKGVTFRFKVQVLQNEKVLYEERAAEFGTSFDEPDQKWIESETEELLKEYIFLLDQYPASASEIKVIYEKTGKGGWRFLFGLQPESWIAEYGIILRRDDPSYRWSPNGEFQLEEVPVGIP